MRQYLPGKKLEIDTITKAEMNELDRHLSKILSEMNVNGIFFLHRNG